MEREVAINSIIRDMGLMGVISEGKEGDAKFFGGLLWTAGFDYYRMHYFNNGKRPILYFNKKDVLLARFPSIRDASIQLKISRNTIDDILYGKTKGRRNTGNYFKYADENASRG